MPIHLCIKVVCLPQICGVSNEKGTRPESCMNPVEHLLLVCVAHSHCLSSRSSDVRLAHAEKKLGRDADAAERHKENNSAHLRRASRECANNSVASNGAPTNVNGLVNIIVLTRMKAAARLGVVADHVAQQQGSSYDRIHGAVSRLPAKWRTMERVAGQELQEVIYEKAEGEGIAKVQCASWWCVWTAQSACADHDQQTREKECVHS